MLHAGHRSSLPQGRIGFALHCSSFGLRPNVEILLILHALWLCMTGNTFVQVIGLACFKAISADGVSFAIPIDTAKDVIQQLQLKGRVIRPFIGIKMLQLNEHNAAQMQQKDPNFPVVTRGILVPHVAAGSPASKGGLREGDIITGRPAAQATSMSPNKLL